jgi:hypothetical protein
MEAAIQECGLQENGVDVPLMQGILSVQKNGAATFRAVCRRIGVFRRAGIAGRGPGLGDCLRNRRNDFAVFDADGNPADELHRAISKGEASSAVPGRRSVAEDGRIVTWDNSGRASAIGLLCFRQGVGRYILLRVGRMGPVIPCALKFCPQLPINPLSISYQTGYVAGSKELHPI